jgi:hypothetical protein
MMRTKFLKLLILALVTLVTVSLTLPSRGASAINLQTSPQRVLGLAVGDQNEVVIAPAAARVSEDFKVTINTFGGGCESKGDEGVILREDSATVMVYDFTVATRPGVVCPAIAQTFPHTVTLQFSKAGEAVIRIWVRRTGPDTPPDGVPIVLERRVAVNP